MHKIRQVNKAHIPNMCEPAVKVRVHRFR
uniref:Uncharacterized protein n=1 Tax=Rhizophora mucronata TaxID=61149 RepID=A0A2P2PCV2_RHIMU